MESGIKSWCKEDRPREKMVEKGAFALSNVELLAILLSSGNKNESAVDLARRILNDCDNQLQKLSKQTIKSLSKYKGVGVAKAVTLMAAMELGNRRISEQVQRKKIKNVEDAYKLVYQFLNNLPYEEFWTIFLDSSNSVISTKKISDGGVAFTAVDPKKIFKMAIDELAVSIIICHNHPSGSIKPSPEDKKLTHRIFEISKVVDVKLLDHIIVGNEQFYSFSDHGELL